MRKVARLFAAVLALVLLGTMPLLAAPGTAARVRHGAVVRSSGSSRLSVLAYHAIDDLDGDPVIGRYSVPPVAFAEHLDFLGARG